MKNVLVNQEVNVSYPDKYQLWDEAKKEQIYGQPRPDRCVIQDPETGTVIEIAWLVPKGFAGKLKKSVMIIAKGDETNMKQMYKKQNYICKDYYEMSNDSFTFTCYEVEYDENNIRQVGKIAWFLHQGIYYKIFACCMKSEAEEGERAFQTILELLSF